MNFGAAPGGWSQVALEISSYSNYTIDLLELKINHPQITFYKEDFLKFNYQKSKKKFLHDIIDIAPTQLVINQLII